ncbi:acyl-CoA dehydrogenase family protein [Parafrankia sp. EUN1f]|uniref:acyl-CoA dehydrogenase family protein n=1 Tax=Parafrankia sp. EUN1f TaxID=102897 RepID=UPI0001C452BD|nr:acyl-CoA dehydrogenase family protein [Parafrankia sp. EUN1f]EFC79057.1 Acyl-CoA dehydrogenase type 2 domain protein [Parafrankia sp. EUN1f]
MAHTCAEVSDETRTWLARVETISATLAENRAQAEADRTTSPAVIDALRAQDFHRMWVSRALGGGGVSLRTGSAVLQAIARVDPSAAWQMGVQGAIGRLSDYLPDKVSCRLFCGSRGLVVGGVNPTGQAVRVPGGYRVSGRWAFASGATHASWLVCTVTLTDGQGAGPAPIRMLCVPSSAVTFVDDWHSLGLRGTGSGSFIVDNVVVPESHAVDGSLLRRPPSPRRSRGYAIAYYDFAPFTTAATTIGIAQQALAVFRELAARTVPARSTEALAERATVHATFARATALVRAAELVLADAADQATTCGEHGGEELSAVVRLAAAAVAENCVQAVTMVHTAAGAAALRSGDALDRCFRDVHTAARHITLATTNFEMVGAHLFGGPLLMRR